MLMLVLQEEEESVGNKCRNAVEKLKREEEVKKQYRIGKIYRLLGKFIDKDSINGKLIQIMRN